MLAALFLACSTAPTTVSPEVTEPIEARPDDRFETRTLDNGVQLSVLPNHHPKNQAYFILLVDAGSEHEAPDASGAAHFVEHMVFNGTRSFPGETLVPWLESRGVPFGHGTNASTSARHTWYTLRVDTRTDEVMAKIPDLFRDIVDGITFDPAAVEAERNILVAEREMRTANGKVERPGGGTDDYRTITAEALVDFHDRWYRSDRVQALVVGDVEPQPTLDRLAATLGTLPAPDEPPPDEPSLEDEGPEQEALRGTFIEVDPVLAEMGLSFESSIVWLGATDDDAGASLIAEVLAARLRGVSGLARVEEGGRVGALASTGAGPMLEAMALPVSPTPKELEVARNTLLLRWAERPFAHRPVSSGTWISHTLRSIVVDDRLPPDPIAEVEHQRQAVLHRSVEQLAALWSEITSFDQLGMFLTTSELTETGPLPEAMVAALREQVEASTTLADRSAPMVPERMPGPVEPLQVDLEGLQAWKTPWGAQLLLRRDDQLPVVWVDVRVPYVTHPALDRARSAAALGGALEALEQPLESHPALSVADTSYSDGHLSVRARVMPDQVGTFLRLLMPRVHQLQGGEVPLLQLQRTTILATGPIEPAVAEQALTEISGLTPEVVPQHPLPDPKPGHGPVTVDPDFVFMYWNRRAASLEELEQLPYLAATLNEAMRLFVREELGQAYKYETTLTLAEDEVQLKLDVKPRAGEHEAIAAELEAIRASLVAAPIDVAMWQRIVMVTHAVDPTDPDPIRWLDAIGGRLVLVDSVVDAATLPATLAPSPAALHALAQLWLNEPWSFD